MITELKSIIIGTAAVILFGVFSSLILSQTFANSDFELQALEFSGSWSCTADFQICPDGSEVYRTPPYCHFASCPR
ncbi:MAG: hypothetical protein A2758_02265 [Candidatus Zambryskibacteria bacterium RIFCSPHIGHO2_01_FULL_49_18]|uniref:Uncharacterized protein n=2 Tax=Candidatus Zambryskiibacteriota TaxID=1817925 RepID=A0A1G2T1U7_9BACT|nr:MAG: hypothetical protein A2758_02265 [Candidatus Zambryskibacteria bacterium RIFCSPHIGHO2_01_FULL_49_18]OHB06148.1 MAG: hypothetical protein A3A26_01225 [Candidatus Zambryskibacteria bacterium RIFCSPLOWO2_01_FULL_47_14]